MKYRKFSDLGWNVSEVGLLHHRVQLPVSVVITTTTLQFLQLLRLFLPFTFLGMVSVSLLEIAFNNLYLLLDLVVPKQTLHP